MTSDSRIQEILERILETHETPEQACRDTPELLAEVRRRWDEARALHAELADAFPSSDDSASEESRVAATTAPLPSIPGYRIEGVLGRGGMGIVYLARQESLGRTVALKMLLAGTFASPKDLARFRREAEAVARIRHPNIVQVHDIGDLDGRPYFTMEYVDGGSLAQRFAKQPPSPVEAAELVAVIADAVEEAHRSGILHRDLKPSNILLTSAGSPKIADFGLARLDDAEQLTTVSGARVGTPSYMAPEQAFGSPRAVGKAADIYSLGAILYELLAGRPPFRGATASETLRLAASSDPVPPSRWALRVPRDLDTICLKCLQRDPGRRYASAHELAADLRRFERHEPILARPAGALERATKWMRRRPALATALVLGLILLGLSSGWGAWWLGERTALARATASDLDEMSRALRAASWAEANAAAQRASGRLCGGHGLTALHARLEQGLSDLRLVKRLEAVRMARALAGTTESIAQSNNEYAVLYREAGIAADADSPDDAARNLRVSNIGAALVAGMYDWLICSQDVRGRDWLLAVLGNADSDHGGIRDRSRDAASWNDPNAVKSSFGAARVAGQSTDYLLWLAQVLKEHGADQMPLLRQVQSARPNDFWANYVIAEALHGRGQHDEAIRFVQSAIAIRPDAAVAHNHLGNYLRSLNRFYESIEAVQEAVRVDPDAAACHGDLGLSLMGVGRYAEAVEQFELGSRQAPSNALFRLHLGHVLTALDRDGEAIEQFKQVAARGPGTVTEREALITGFILARRTAEAIPVLRSWIDRSPGNYQLWDGLAELCLFVGATEEYESTRKSLLDSFGTSPDPVVCVKLGLACMLAPISEDQRRVASAAIDRALESERTRPTWLAPYLKSAKAMAALRSGRPDASLRLISQASSIFHPAPMLITALALSSLGRDAEALSALARATTIGDWRPMTATSSEAWMTHVLRREAESRILPNLDGFTRGTYWPSTADERLALIATSEDKGMHVATARLFAEALDGDPLLARNVDFQGRYRAAVAAAMCGSGLSKDSSSITPEERGHWRAQSLQWLREEFIALRDRAPKTKRLAMLARWQADRELRGVRDPALLATLSEGDQAAFKAFWAEVKGVLASRD